MIQTVVGDTFYHCDRCADFDVCLQCYSDDIHPLHKDSLQKGMYPKYSPYGMCITVYPTPVDKVAI